MQSDCLATLVELQENLDTITPIFLLIDPMLGEPLPGGELVAAGKDAQPIRAAIWQREIFSIALSQPSPLPVHQHPYLVALTGLDDPWLDITLELAHAERRTAMEDGLDGEGLAAHRIGGWLQSTMHPSQLAEALAGMFRVKTDAFTNAHYLRLPDRRVLALLRHVAGDTRVIAQLGRLQRWLYLDAYGQLSSLHSTAEDISPLHLSSKEWREMEAGEMLNRTLAQWLGECQRRDAVPSSRIPVATLYPRLQQAIAAIKPAATQWPHRFVKVHDQTAWAALNLLHPDFSHNKAVQELMRQRGSEQEPAEPFRYLHQQVSAILDASTQHTPGKP